MKFSSFILSKPQNPFPLPYEPLQPTAPCVPTLPGQVGRESFGWRKRSVPIRQISKRNKFPYAWILITYMWIINMSHESKWSTHVCKWAIHRDYFHRNLWRPNPAVAEVNSNVSINLIMLWICQAHNKILQYFHWRTAFLKLQIHCQFLQAMDTQIHLSRNDDFISSFQNAHTYKCYLKQLILEPALSKPTPCANPDGYISKTATSA